MKSTKKSFFLLRNRSISAFSHLLSENGQFSRVFWHGGRFARGFGDAIGTAVWRTGGSGSTYVSVQDKKLTVRVGHLVPKPVGAREFVGGYWRVCAFDRERATQIAFGVVAILSQPQLPYLRVIYSLNAPAQPCGLVHICLQLHQKVACFCGATHARLIAVSPFVLGNPHRIHRWLQGRRFLLTLARFPRLPRSGHGSAVTRAVTNTKMRPLSPRSMLPNWLLTIAISDATRLSRASCSVARASVESGHQVTLSVFSGPPLDVTSPKAFLNRSFLARNTAPSPATLSHHIKRTPTPSQAPAHQRRPTLRSASTAQTHGSDDGNVHRHSGKRLPLG